MEPSPVEAVKTTTVELHSDHWGILSQEVRDRVAAMYEADRNSKKTRKQRADEYTAREDEFLKTYYGQPLRPKQCADHLGRSLKSVHRRARILGITHREHIRTNKEAKSNG